MSPISSNKKESRYRIYQGRVNGVEIKSEKKTDFQALANDPKTARQIGEQMLLKHHELFQDAVNYYIVALAALGNTSESPLTKLRELLQNVWDVADKSGQRREGMGKSLQRTWQLLEPPTLEEASKRFTDPLKADNVCPKVAQKAAEYLLFELDKLNGEKAIQQGGSTFCPMFCNVDFDGTFNLSSTRRQRTKDEQRLAQELSRELNANEIHSLARSITLGSVVNLSSKSPDLGHAAVQRLRSAAELFPESKIHFEEWLKGLDDDFSLPKNRKGNKKRVAACILFLAFPNAVTKKIFQSTLPAPKDINTQRRVDDSFAVDGNDPIELSRGTRGCVFTGFTALPLWKGDGKQLAWTKFDIAAFKEALKVYKQFQQNLKNREEKLNDFAKQLLRMDGQRAIDAYAEDEKELRQRLETIWHDPKGRQKMLKKENEEETQLPRFFKNDKSNEYDPRIERLRKIVNDDLAEEYRLTDGTLTPYGLRRRTMNGWGDVKQSWQRLVKKGIRFSDETKEQLKKALNDLRREKREQIGSHKLFEALIADEEAWCIWREPDDSFQEEMVKNNWATDPLEAFRKYCEIREKMEAVSKRTLKFTPADAQYSRRLFSFTDALPNSFGKPNGTYKHDPKKQAITVPVAVCGIDGKFSKQTCYLSYSAPRLLRDQIRAEDGSYIQNWMQPMMRALFGEQEGQVNPQDLDKAAVQLMPDFNSRGERRMLLNFQLDLDDHWLKSQIGKATLWEKQFGLRKKQFGSRKNGEKAEFLRWEKDFTGKESHRWWNKLTKFSVLGVDLGVRHAASTALLECSQEVGKKSRYIGEVDGKKWFARYRSGGILRLPGENVKVLRPESILDEDGLGKTFREELYGKRGRSADHLECEETVKMLAVLKELNLIDNLTDHAEIQKRFSFPELNDKLLIAVRRAQSWIAKCISCHWKLKDPDSENQLIRALNELVEQQRRPDWKTLAKEILDKLQGQAKQQQRTNWKILDDSSEANRVALRDSLHTHIIEQRECIQKQLEKLTERILPLRGRGWEWVRHPDKEDCFLLRQTLDGTASKQVKLRGQRGLSMARIEQLSELRRRWQSLNQSLRRQIGKQPPTASEMRDDSIPDPCPDILAKLENIREQRVNQTAHLILAQALGLKLRAPKMSAQSRKNIDMHGEYESVRPPVDFIVLEDLSRYLSNQGRTKRENTRLMQWCHRAVMQKVKELAEPFGIPVLETPAAYSSRFCSLTGIVGFRATEVGWADRHHFPWRVLWEEAQKARKEGKTPSEKARYVEDLFEQLKQINCSNHSHRTLIAPQAGGPLFVTAQDIRHPAPASRRQQLDKCSVLPMQADLNAAVNLAMRAVAHPDCADIHHRMRTKRENGGKNQPDTILAREDRRFCKEKVSIVLRNGDTLPKERNTNFFYDKYEFADFGRARIERDSNTTFPYASGPGIWKKADRPEVQWKRCFEINAARLQDWGLKPSPHGNTFEDDIPL